MTSRTRWTGKVVLLALAVAALVVLLVANWSRSLVAGLAAVVVMVVLIAAAAVALWQGADF